MHVHIWGLASQAGNSLAVHSQAGAHLHPKEGRSLVASQASQAGR